MLASVSSAAHTTAQTLPLSNHHPNNYSCHNFCHSRKFHTTTVCRATINTSSHSFSQRPLVLTTNFSSTTPSSTAFAHESEHSLQNSHSNSLYHVSLTSADDSADQGGEDNITVCSASAVASAIRKASTSPVEFVLKIDKDGKNKSLVLPSPDFQRLCLQQLALFRRIVDPNALLSVYVRPAGSYVMDRLELRRVIFYPEVDVSDIAILIGNFSIPTGLRAAEAAISDLQAEFIPDSGAVVFPMVKHPFVVGFLVAELSNMALDRAGHDAEHYTFQGSNALPLCRNTTSWKFQYFKDNPFEKTNFTADQRLNAINISCSLAMAYVMDQKAILLQQSSWQNSVRMSNLVEQIRGPLSSIRTLSKMLSAHMKRSEISYDVVEDLLVQGDRMKDTLQQLQDAVYLTKVNIVRYNEEALKRMHQSAHDHSESVHSQCFNNFSKLQENGEPSSISSISKDLELPMPPLALAPLRQQGIRRPCNVSDVLADLVGAVETLAHKQRRVVELCQLSRSLQVAVEEPALRQALSNLIEGALLRTLVGGKVEIVSTRAPASGTLVIIDDDGPDMHYMTQMHSLAPFGADLLSEDMVEDNMTWNFVAGLTVAREILESYGCVVRVISPRITDAALGAGGTRVELWLPSFSTSPYPDGPAQQG